jgi:hypothetical protein
VQQLPAGRGQVRLKHPWLAGLRGRKSGGRPRTPREHVPRGCGGCCAHSVSKSRCPRRGRTAWQPQDYPVFTTPWGIRPSPPRRAESSRCGERLCDSSLSCLRTAVVPGVEVVMSTSRGAWMVRAPVPRATPCWTRPLPRFPHQPTPLPRTSRNPGPLPVLADAIREVVPRGTSTVDLGRWGLGTGRIVFGRDLSSQASGCTSTCFCSPPTRKPTHPGRGSGSPGPRARSPQPPRRHRASPPQET